MIWLVLKESSHQIVSCNTHFRDGIHELWVERNNGKTLKIAESDNLEEVKEIKDAIDFAIKNGHKTLDLSV